MSATTTRERRGEEDVVPNRRASSVEMLAERVRQVGEPGGPATTLPVGASSASPMELARDLETRAAAPHRDSEAKESIA